MTGAEQGFLLLGSNLGNPVRNPLTPAQIQRLASRVRAAPKQTDLRAIRQEDLLCLGYGEEEAQRILELLSQEELLGACLRRAEFQHCIPLTPASDGYPVLLRQKLGWKMPVCLWAKGNLELLNNPMVSLVGSRALYPENQYFAKQVGLEAARQGYTLVSGNARGADQSAQEAALEAGGTVISVVADELMHHFPTDRQLFLSENCFDLPFSPYRALSRNAVIHALGEKVFVAQSGYEKGGTWEGTVKNLHMGWSPVFCFRDGSEAIKALHQLGASQIGLDQLTDFSALTSDQISLY